MKDLTGNLPHKVRRKIDQKVCDFLGIGKGLKGALFDVFLKNLFGNMGGHSRTHEPGIDSIDENLFAAQFLCKSFGYCNESAFGSRIIRRPVKTAQPGPAYKHENFARRAFKKQWQELFRQVKRRFQVHLHHFIPILFGHFFKKRIRSGCCIVDQDIQPLRLPLENRHKLIDGFSVGKITGVTTGAKRLQLFGKILGLKIGEKYFGAIFKSFTNKCLAKLACPACDKSGFSVKKRFQDLPTCN